MEKNNFDIKVKKAEDELTICLTGRVDTNTAPLLQDRVEKEMIGMMNLTIDMEKVNYISSAGLRVLLSTEKKMEESGGSMRIIHVGETVKEIFQITGFDEILTIQ